MRFKLKLVTIACAAVWPAVHAQAPLETVADASAVQPASLVLTPAVIMVRCRPGQSTSQVLSIVNNTASDISFNVSTEDVVIRDGQRVFLPAGQTEKGIASSAVAVPASLVVKAGGEASVQVTFTLPSETIQRAVVTFFRGNVAMQGNGVIGLAASMGTLVTFDLSGDYQLEAGQLHTSVQTAAANTILSQGLHNRGSEPVVPRGVIAILNASGKRVAKASFLTQRLLPGERLVVSATNPAQLPPGRYRTFSSFEFERKVITSAGEFTIPK